MSDDIRFGRGFAQYYNQSNGSSPRRPEILDSTLREGEQSPGVTFTARQRIQIAWLLDYFGVNSIEVSPVISLEHERSLREMLRAGLSARIIAHLRALAQDIDVALNCGAEWIAVYHSASDIHLKYKLRVSRDEAIKRSIAAVDYARAHGLKLRFTLEDASRADPQFLASFAKEVAKAGAERIGLPDTVGVLRPAGVFRMVSLVREVVDVPIDVHCHNDLGLAVANSLAGFEAGASQIHTTINGIGERVGIAPLDEVVLTLRVIYGIDMNLRLEMLRELSETVENYAGVKTPPSKPLVGSNAYRHKAGTHIAAVLRNPEAYEIVPPEVVGGRRRLIFGELSGKNGAAFLLKILGVEPDGESAAKVSKGLKNLRCGDLFELELSKELAKQALTVEEEVKARV